MPKSSHIQTYDSSLCIGKCHTYHEICWSRLISPKTSFLWTCILWWIEWSLFILDRISVLKSTSTRFELSSYFTHHGMS
jgi:hypothetical protein